MSYELDCIKRLAINLRVEADGVGLDHACSGYHVRMIEALDKLNGHLDVLAAREKRFKEIAQQVAEHETFGKHNHAANEALRLARMVAS